MFWEFIDINFKSKTWEMQRFMKRLYSVAVHNADNFLGIKFRTPLYTIKKDSELDVQLFFMFIK